MLETKDLGIILEKTDHEFENMGVLNPACVQKEDDEYVHMYYRAVGKDKMSTERSSCVGYAKLKDNKVVERLDIPFMNPQHSYERQGIEDPHITKIEDHYYMTYTAYDGKNARIALAKSKDLQAFDKMGLVSPSITYDEAENLFRQSKLQERYFLFEALYKQKLGEEIKLWEKDAVLFPRKINGRYAMLHRILPGIQLIYFDKFEDLNNDEYWREYLKNLGAYVVLDPKHWFESRNVGGGCIPIETEYGWLLIYHAVEDTSESKIYHAAAVLLDLENPIKIVARMNKPLFSPTHNWEKQGIVNDVVFPTGTAIQGENLIIYYGAADKLIAAKSVNFNELIQELKASGV
ncbi:MAG: pesticidal protein Cry7Aa [Candidatus Moranbacteria bacterium]|nr:pesticidal protein Cry7Aa [Candidatus Moranbacteria bacterium]